jgi:hypothetical protein
VTLSQEESIFWKLFPNCEKSYILNGDSQCSLDFTSNQTSGYLIDDELEIEEGHSPPILPAKENLYFNSNTSSEESNHSDDPISNRLCNPV